MSTCLSLQGASSVHSLITPGDRLINGFDGQPRPIRLCPLCKRAIQETVSNLRWPLQNAIEDAERLMSRYHFEINEILLERNVETFGDNLSTLDQLIYDVDKQSRILISLRVLRNMLRHADYNHTY